MLMLWNCAQLYAAAHTLRRAQIHYALYAELFCFTQFYAVLRGANIHYAALRNIRCFTQLNELYAAERSLRSFTQPNALYAA